METLMTEETKLRPVVDLFLNRIASYPEELASGKWKWIEQEIMEHGTAEEREAVRAVVSEYYLTEVHKEFMEMLLAGEEVNNKSSGADANPLGFPSYPLTPESPTITTFNAQVKVRGDIQYTGRLRRVSK